MNSAMFCFHFLYKAIYASALNIKNADATYVETVILPVSPEENSRKRRKKMKNHNTLTKITTFIVRKIKNLCYICTIQSNFAPSTKKTYHHTANP